MPLLVVMLTALAAQSLSVQANARVRLENGDRVRILNVSDVHQRKAWDPTGKPLPYNPPGFLVHLEDKDRSLKPNPTNALMIVAEIARPKRLTDAPNVAFKVSSRGMIDSSFTYYDEVSTHDPALWTAGMSRPFSVNATTVSVGVAEGRWHTAGRYDLRQGKPGYVSGIKFAPKVFEAKPRPKVVTSITVNVALTVPIVDRAVRIVALDEAGTEASSSGSMSEPGGLLKSYYFLTSMARVARIELQTRPYEWTTFRGVALKPNP